MAAVQLNIAAALLGLEQYAAAADSCSAVLQLQRDSIKALLRRAKAYGHMHEYAVCTGCHPVHRLPRKCCVPSQNRSW